MQPSLLVDVILVVTEHEKIKKKRGKVLDANTRKARKTNGTRTGLPATRVSHRIAEQVLEKDPVANNRKPTRITPIITVVTDGIITTETENVRKVRRSDII